MSTPVRLEALHTAFTISRPAAAAVLVTITGRDTGELGEAPFRELERQLETGAVQPEIFVDARDTLGATIDVSAAWAAWLNRHRGRYARLHMLTGSRFVTLTATFVQRFAALGEHMRIYTDPQAFEAALADLCQPGRRRARD